ncbi:unnamed protein product [Haemonchus placei]|uniref:ABC transmembrane type-1 domain-containing protein n=1 Tax=Haemonchus placei TaxID=6290 RepID=A0A0N4WRW0_HAEPC|nr:unnamed protein product [Haemonchus placei]
MLAAMTPNFKFFTYVKALNPGVFEQTGSKYGDYRAFIYQALTSGPKIFASFLSTLLGLNLVSCGCKLATQFLHASGE